MHYLENKVLNTSSVGEVIPYTSRNPNGNYPVYNNFLPVRILRQRERVLDFSFHFLRT